MKTKITVLKLTLILLLALPFGSFAKTYALYLCGSTSTATLTPTIAGINPTDQVIWTDVTGSSNVIKTGSGTDMNYTVPAGLSVGEHTYRVHAVSASPNTCTGDYAEVVFYVLPDITVNVTLPTTPDYCENATSPSTTITANPNTLAADVTDIEFAYVWTAANGSGPITPVTGVGTASGNTFNMTTTTVGTYTFTATATYVLKSGATGLVKSTCTNSGTSGPVKVNPKPATPTISIS